MDNFDLKKYLVENNLTRNSIKKSIFERFLDGETEFTSVYELINSLTENDEDRYKEANKIIKDLTPEDEAAAIAFAVNTSGDIIATNDLTKDTFGTKFMTWLKGKEEEYGDLAKNIQNKVRVAKVLVGALAATVLLNTVGSIAGKTINKKVNSSDKQSQEITQTFQKDLKNSLGDEATADFAAAKAAIKQNKAYDVNPDGDEVHIQMATGESDITPEDLDQIKKVKLTVQKILKKNPNSKAVIKIKVGVSNQGSKESNKSNNGTNLTNNRVDAIKQAFGNTGENISLVVEPVNYQDSKITNTSDQNPSQGGTIGVDFKSPEAVKKVDKILKLFVDYQINPPAPKVLAPTDQKTSPKSEPGSTTNSVDSNLNNPPKTGKTDEPTRSTPSPSTGNQEFSQRNTQLAVLLKGINAGSDAFKELGVPYNTRLTQSIFNKAQTDMGKDLVALVTAIRKNPDYFLNKVNKLTGQNLTGREKSKSRFSESLVTENVIDDLLIKVGISDDVIKQKSKSISNYLRKIYKLTGDQETNNSNTKKTSQDVEKISKALEQNPTVITQLERIDTVAELSLLLAGMIKFLDAKLGDDTGVVSNTLQTVKSELPKNYQTSTTGQGVTFSIVKEAESLPDTAKTLEVLARYPNLVRLLKNVNNRIELKDLMLLVIDSVKQSLSNDKNKISTALVNATNIIRSLKFRK